MSHTILTIGSVSLVSLLSGVACTLAFTAEALEVALPTDGAADLSEVSRDVDRIGSRMTRVEKVLARELAATRRDIREGNRAVLSALDTAAGPLVTNHHALSGKGILRTSFSASDFALTKPIMGTSYGNL